MPRLSTRWQELGWSRLDHANELLTTLRGCRIVDFGRALMRSASAAQLPEVLRNFQDGARGKRPDEFIGIGGGIGLLILDDGRRIGFLGDMNVDTVYASELDEGMLATLQKESMISGPVVVTAREHPEFLADPLRAYIGRCIEGVRILRLNSDLNPARYDLWGCYGALVVETESGNLVAAVRAILGSATDSLNFLESEARLDRAKVKDERRVF